MSLLADLLSKNNSAEPSARRDIPPTLVQAHGMPYSTRNSKKKRYIVSSLVFLAAVATGVLAMFQFGLFTPFSTKKSELTSQRKETATSAAAVVPTPTPPPAAVSVTATGLPASSVHTTQATQTIQKSTEKATGHEAGAAKRSRQKRYARTDKTPKLEAIQPAKRAANKKQSASPTVAESETAPSGPVDTATRDSLLYAARSAEQSGNWSSALMIYRKALKVDPENYKILSNTAAALNNLGMFDEGEKEARLALNKKPDYVPAMINAAIAYSARGNSQDALLLFSKASSADPTNRNLAINFGILQERTGKLDDAQKTYRRLADEGDPLALHGMGRIYERTGNKNEAARVYRQIMAQPNASPALKKEVKEKLLRLE